MKPLSFAQQMALAFGLLLAMLVATIGLSIYQQGQLAGLTEKQYRHPFTVSNAVARLDANTARIRRLVGDILLDKDESRIAHAVAEIARLDTLVQQDMALAKERFLGDKSDFDVLAAQYLAWTPLREKVVALKLAGEGEAAVALMFAQSSPQVDSQLATRQKIYSFAMKKAEGFQLNAAKLRDEALSTTLMLGALALVAGIVVAVRMTRAVTRPLLQAVAIARAVAQGNLTVPIEVQGGHETTQLLLALKEMQASLTLVVENVRQGSESVATASAQIAQGNQDLSGRTEQQASALQQSAAAMAQLGATVRNTAGNAQQANALAMGACELAAEGGQVVGQVVGTMRGINDSSKKIADIISVIDGIAFQTNILALNAAVEAARAGEQGRGFAVVASEVRSLAQRSADAAKEIKTLIVASVERVEQGTTLVDQAGAKMQEIVGSIRRVTDIVGEISQASGEQSQGVQQMSQSVSQMDQTTQQNSALVEQSAAAAESLRQQASHLVQAVAGFRLGTAAPQASVDDMAWA